MVENACAALRESEAAPLASDSPWTLVATVSGARARKRNLAAGAYAFRVRPADAAGYEWSPGVTAKIPSCPPLFGRLFGASLVSARGAARSVAGALAGKLVAVYASASW